jgi:hypothetical protein
MGCSKTDFHITSQVTVTVLISYASHRVICPAGWTLSNESTPFLKFGNAIIYHQSYTVEILRALLQKPLNQYIQYNL